MYLNLLLAAVSSSTLTPANAAQAPLQDGGQVRSILTTRVRASPTDENACSGNRGFSGYIDTEDDRHLYFWAFPSQSNPETDPVILWLTGGPGASGVSFGALGELGPCLYDGNWATRSNQYSWHSNATVIFVDQPVNVGYSYSTHKVSTLQESTTDLLMFMDGFFEGFPEYAGLPFYVAGESYGGSYVPALASRIRQRQKAAPPSSAPAPRAEINMKGILVGNGLFNDVSQRRGFYELACVRDFGGQGQKFLNSSLCEEMLQSSERCADLGEHCMASDRDTSICSASSSYCNEHLVGMITRVGRSPYDIRSRCYPDEEGGSLCMAPTTLNEWLNSTEMRQRLHVDEGVEYLPLNFELEQAFEANGEIGYPSDHLLTELLEDGIPVLIYVGNMDWYCNAPGMRYLVDGLAWRGQAAFRSLPYQEKYLPVQNSGEDDGSGTDQKLWGYHKKYEKLSFFEIDDAGHMAPADKGRETKEMVYRWMSGDL